jgi:DNA-binding CsgD family transcriptional regulator
MLENLSPREREVFDLLLEGISQKEIANKLNISHSTLDFHRTNLYKKLGVHSIKELFAKYSTNDKTAPSEPETALPVPGTKRQKSLKLLLPFGIAAGIIVLALSVSLIWIFVIKPSPRPKGVIIPVYNLGFFSWPDAKDRRGESTAEVFITSEEIDGVEINGVLNIKTDLKGRENSNEFYANISTTKYDVIQRLRQANGIRFKARGDGKSWIAEFFTKESTQKTNYAHYQYIFGTVRDKVIVYDIPYSSLILPEYWEKYSFDFNKESIKILSISANNTTQDAGSSFLQIFDFEIY